MNSLSGCAMHVIKQERYLRARRESGLCQSIKGMKLNVKTVRASVMLRNSGKVYRRITIEQVIL